MKYPMYVKTADGYIGSYAYNTSAGPVYRFPGGTRLADSWELEHGTDRQPDPYGKEMKSFGPWDNQPHTVTLTNVEWSTVLAIIEITLKSPGGDGWLEIQPTLPEVLNIICGYDGTIP